MSHGRLVDWWQGAPAPMGGGSPGEKSMSEKNGNQDPKNLREAMRKLKPGERYMMMDADEKVVGTLGVPSEKDTPEIDDLLADEPDGDTDSKWLE